MTKVITKDGREYNGVINKNSWKPAFNRFTLCWQPKVFSFSECESITTEGVRTSSNSPPEGETVDEMLKAHEDLEYGRKNGWTDVDEDGCPHPYPKEQWDWEKKYNKGEKNV